MKKPNIKELAKRAITVKSDGTVLGNELLFTVVQAGSVTLAGMELQPGTYQLQKLN